MSDSKRAGSSVGRMPLASLLRLLVSVGLIAWLVSRAELASVAETIVTANPYLVVVAFLSYFVGYVFSVTRWSALLSAHGVRAGFGYLYSSFMIGMFFNQILPTTVGGDFARYHYTSNLGRGAAFSAVLMDRVFGVVSLMIFAFAGIVFAERFDAIPSGIFGAVAGLLGLGLGAIAVIFLLPAAQLERLRRLYSFLPRKLTDFFDKILDVFSVYRGQRNLLLWALLLSLMLQCVVVGHYYVVGLALGFDVPFYGYAYIVPIAIVIMMLPISINGIGVRESTFALLLATYGVQSSEALAYSWVVYGLILIHGLIGGLVFAAVRRARAVS